MNDNLGLIVLESHKELGENINNYLKILRNNEDGFIIPVKLDRFANGEGKATILDSVREKDIYILTDTQNYSITYNIRTVKNHMSPDDHFQDILRVIGAMSGHAAKINVIMPFLYQSRQHDKEGQESLDCAMALRHLENLRVKSIMTVDAHAKSVLNAVPYMDFTNYFPTRLMIEQILKDNLDMENIIVIAPDRGATGRANYLADKIGNVGIGSFYKRRDLTTVVNGRNPILQHEYSGNDVEGKDAIIVDDMISSGGSMIKTAEYLKRNGANKIYMITSFALFDKGILEFNKAYERGIFNKVYATNGAYIEEDILNSEWFQVVDLSEVMANIINDLHEGKSLKKYLRK